MTVSGQQDNYLPQPMEQQVQQQYVQQAPYQAVQHLPFQQQQSVPQQPVSETQSKPANPFLPLVQVPLNVPNPQEPLQEEQVQQPLQQQQQFVPQQPVPQQQSIQQVSQQQPAPVAEQPQNGYNTYDDAPYDEDNFDEDSVKTETYVASKIGSEDLSWFHRQVDKLQVIVEKHREWILHLTFLLLGLIFGYAGRTAVDPKRTGAYAKLLDEV